MGGYGSGRQNGKRTTSDMLAIDVRQWKRDGLIVAGTHFSCYWTFKSGSKPSINVRVENTTSLTLSYRTRSNGSEWVDQKIHIPLYWTQCNYGGQRIWFACPRCSKRVAKLYSGTLFLCRHCHQLAYDCQHETNLDRASRSADKTRKKLGWEAGILNGNGNKPKRMRWTTYAKLMKKHTNDMLAVMHGFREKFGQHLEY